MSMAKMTAQNEQPLRRAKKIAAIFGPLLFGANELEKCQSAATDMVVAATNFVKVSKFLVNVIQNFHFVFVEQSAEQLFQNLHDALDHQKTSPRLEPIKENN